MKMKIRFIKNFVSILWTLFAVFSASLARADVIEIPFSLNKAGELIVKADVNGKTGNFMLDTGLSVSVLMRSELAEKAMLKRASGSVDIGIIRKAQRLTNATINIAATGKSYSLPASSKDDILVADFKALFGGFALEEDFDGVIGMSAFDGYGFDLDISKKTLMLYSGKDHAELIGYSCVTSAEKENGLVHIQLSMSTEGKALGKQTFLLDTGNNLISLKP